MLHRVEVGLKPHVKDTVGGKTAQRIREAIGLPVERAEIIKVYTLSGLTAEQIDDVVERGALHDPVLHTVSLTPLAEDFDWIVEVGFRPGVTDNEGRTARETLGVVLGLDKAELENVAVYTSTQYLLFGNLSEEDARTVGRDFLANELIQRFEYRSRAQGSSFEAKAAKVTGRASDQVNLIDIFAMSDDELMAFSRENTLALNLDELHAIRAHYADPEVQAKREQAGVDKLPTDAEIEVLAQTWSEHCKHKIFTAKIDYQNKEQGTRETVDSLFKTFIQDSTARIREAKGEDDLCLSVFKDNAGVFKFTDDVAACIKVETHNSPSALDPYGGALTGIVGVNRDPMGTGMGANLVCNTDVFCFASPFWEGELPPRLLHPRRVLEGVREGVEHGGNKSGIPTVNGSVVFDERYLGKPLVYCGTIGLIPKDVDGRPAHEKYPEVGDLIVMTGGRIGKDGIHGATFSSEELHEDSPATAVQIGDPITQRKMYDFLMRARDMGLYSAITDNGAGGLSSSVGETAEFTGGCRMDISKAPLKYDGLQPWEILLSEAQERMSLAVPKNKLDAFMELAGEMDVEASVLGEFTDTGYFHVTYGDKPVAYLDMDFLHDGVPQLQLEAVWERPEHNDFNAPEDLDQSGFLKKMLGRLNICSKEYIVRQYDHEVQGGSAVKPMVGVERDGPGNAGVFRPVLESDKGLAVSHGICPKFSDLDTYWMMANAIDEAVRNAVAVGADPDQMVGVDNFCWCDPVESEKTPDGKYKLAQLVRANQALAHFCQSYGVPCISGKDSMKNDANLGGKKISIPPTVLFSLTGIVPDVAESMTSDFKQAGDKIYLLGVTLDELGGSEAVSELDSKGGSVPQVEALDNRRRYRTLHKAIRNGLVTACHDLSDGGLGVALAEMCIGGRLGADVSLDNVPVTEKLGTFETLYSESAGRLLVSVAPDQAETFEKLFKGQRLGLVGEVTSSNTLTISENGKTCITVPVDQLTSSFKDTLNW